MVAITSSAPARTCRVLGMLVSTLKPREVDRVSGERISAIRRALDGDTLDARAMTAEEARVALGETIERLGAADTILGEVGATIARRDSQSLHGPGRLPAISMEAALPEDAVDDDGADLVAGEVLGRGGMGLVRLAQQRSLRRDVAVKTSGKSDVAAIRALVREARITGGLEHPNVVPVHALGVDREGAPLLVMKRIEGVSWRTLVQNDAHEAWAPLLAGHGDRLRAHVEILMQVSRALGFAHDRGVIHRDVKSENVMIGRFGEVYLVDWGVALRLEEREAEPRAIVGTPGFIAPEMARGDPKLVGTHTDVYLLGATLYEVLARKPPHDAPNALAAMVLSLVGAPPALPPEAPRELVLLVRRAMAPAPSDRIESAEAFREALARYLTSREADLVLAEGRAALARAEAIIAKDGAEAPDAFRALIEARFAFASTFRSRADEESRVALDGCLTLLVERELALRSPGGARTLLGEMSAAPEGLSTRVAALEESIRAERGASDDRERARREADSSRSLGAMLTTVVIMLVVLVLAWGTLASGGFAEDLGAAAALEMWTAGFLGFGVAAFLARRQIMTNEATRALGAFLGIALLTPFACTLAAVQLGAPMYQRSIYSWVASAGIALLGEVKILPQIWPCAVVYLAGSLALYQRPTWAFGIQPLVILGTAAILVRALRRHAERSRV
jgi:hypothetical protein